MPAGQERLLRRRIRSIESTQKITRAMELIAASRIVRAQQAIQAARPYTEKMEDVVAEIASAPEAKDHWIFAGGGQGSLVVVLGADRGLAGAFNINVNRAADELLRELETRGTQPDVIGVGPQGEGLFPLPGPSISRQHGRHERPSSLRRRPASGGSDSSRTRKWPDWPDFPCLYPLFEYGFAAGGEPSPRTAPAARARR